MSDQALTNFFIAVVGGTIAWIVGTICLAVFFGSLPTELASFDDGSMLADLANTWWTIGQILGILDLIAFLGVVSEMFGGGSGF